MRRHIFQHGVLDERAGCLDERGDLRLTTRAMAGRTALIVASNTEARKKALAKCNKKAKKVKNAKKRKAALKRCAKRR